MRCLGRWATPGAVRAAEARYRLLIALTEVHLGGPVPERRAWWGDALESVDTVREEGIDVRAATTWSVSGSWERPGLLARREGHDELGAPLPLDSGDPGATVEGGHDATVGAVAAG